PNMMYAIMDWLPKASIIVHPRLLRSSPPGRLRAAGTAVAGADGVRSSSQGIAAMTAGAAHMPRAGCHAPPNSFAAGTVAAAAVMVPTASAVEYVVVSGPTRWGK